MVWLRQKAAVRGSATFLNASDAAILWLSSEEPYQVEATVVRDGVVGVFRTTDREVHRASARRRGGGALRSRSRPSRRGTSSSTSIA